MSVLPYTLGPHLGPIPLLKQMPPVPRKRIMYPKKIDTYPPLNPKQKKQVRRIASRLSDHKQARFVPTAISSLLHGNTYVYNPFWNIAEGSGNENRTGSEVMITGLQIHGYVEGQGGAAEGSVQYRIRLYEDAENTFGATTYTTVQQISQQSVGFYGVGPSIIEANDKFQVKCIYDQVVQLDQFVTSATYSKAFRAWIPLRKKFTFATNGFMKDKSVYFTISPWIHGGTLNTTDCGFFTASFTTYFSE